MRLLLFAPTIRSFCTSTPAKERLGELVKKSPVVVFMKGNPAAPRCGFSNAVVQVLRMHDVAYDSHDVLQDEDIRQGDIMKYSSIFKNIMLDITFLN